MLRKFISKLRSCKIQLRTLVSTDQGEKEETVAIETAVTLRWCVQIYSMMYRTKVTDILNPNKFRDCELQQ